MPVDPGKHSPANVPTDWKGLYSGGEGIGRSKQVLMDRLGSRFASEADRCSQQICADMKRKLTARLPRVTYFGLGHAINVREGRIIIATAQIAYRERMIEMGRHRQRFLGFAECAAGPPALSSAVADSY